MTFYCPENCGAEIEVTQRVYWGLDLADGKLHARPDLHAATVAGAFDQTALTYDWAIYCAHGHQLGEFAGTPDELAAHLRVVGRGWNPTHGAAAASPRLSP